MVEIREYRGWSLTREEWAYGFLGTYGEGDFYITDGDDTWHAIDRNSVSQYIGLNDIDGVKIYGGDIVSYTQWPRGVVTWSSIRCGYYIEAIDGDDEGNDDLEIHSDEMKDHNVEVVGNTYQNPELLKAIQ